MGIRSINIKLTFIIIPPMRLEDLFANKIRKKKSSKFETNSYLDDRLRTIQYSKSRMEFSNTDVSTRKLLGVESSNPSMIQLYLTSIRKVIHPTKLIVKSSHSSQTAFHDVSDRRDKSSHNFRCSTSYHMNHW